MKDLPINRSLDESTRVETTVIHDKFFPAHITKKREVIITEQSDYTKIYSVMSLEFYNFLVGDR